MLGGLAKISRSQGNSVVTHYNIQSAIELYSTTQSRDLGSVAKDVQKVIDANKKYLPRGVTVTLRGQVQTMNTAFTGLSLGLLAAETRQFDLAETYFLDLVKRNVRLADAYFELGRIEEQRGNYAKAKEWYGRVAGEDRTLTARMRIGVTLAKAGDPTAVVSQHFDALRRANPQNSIMLYLAEAEALREAERFQEAFDVLDRALQLHSNDKDLLYARALLAERIDRLDVLERDLRAIIAADPKNGQALNALGYTLADRTDRYPEALGYIEQALAVLPDDAAVLDSMGWVQYRLGDYPKALDYLRRAYQTNPDAEIAAHLGEALWVSGQREEAKKIWREARRKTPDSRHLRQLQERFGW